MSEVRAAVEAHVRALNHGDLVEILDTFTPDASFRADGVDASGRAELAGIFDVVAGDARPQTILRSTRVDGARAACVLTRRFEMVDEQGTVRGSHEVDVRVVFTVSQGAIRDVQVAPVG